MKNIPEGNFLMSAKTLQGLEDLLYDELVALGAMRVEKHRRMVSFWGDKGFMYKANLNLRTALSVLLPIKTEKVFDEKQLYKAVYSIAWERYITGKDSILIDATVFSEKFRNSHFVELKCKDAIVDRIRDKMNSRPSVDKEDPTLKINIHISDVNLTISLDSSGEPLYKRGYRLATNIAPINEVLAAALVMFTGWKGGSNFLDPMCGSGTILIEAAMIAANIPANINRKKFAFEKWNDFDKELFDKIRDISINKIRDVSCKIIGYDKVISAVSKSIENIKNATLEEFIKVERKNFFDTEKPEGEWILVFNPPYGERLDKIEVEDFYKKIGDTLKNKYQGASAWIITSSQTGIKSIGLKHSRSIPLLNSNLEAKFLKYEMYSGSKKQKYEDNQSEL